jgi:AcrR family transcriptional regulator
MSSRPYHHGDLYRALLDQATVLITELGPTGWSLRELARQVGVSHAAPSHHFGDKTGLLTALAAEGFERLAGANREVRERGGSFLEQGVAYVRFAVDHPAHFEVMFRPDLHHRQDPRLIAARQSARDQLYPPAREAAHLPSSDWSAGLAAWSLVHGLATLWLNGALPPEVTADPESLTRQVASHLFPTS